MISKPLLFHFINIFDKISLKELRFSPRVTVVCSSEVLCFYCHLLCSTDTEVGFVVLMFKRQQNESPFGKCVTVTESVSIKWTVV
jgi:hypothetical protein